MIVFCLLNIDLCFLFLKLDTSQLRPVVAHVLLQRSSLCRVCELVYLMNLVELDRHSVLHSFSGVDFIEENSPSNDGVGEPDSL